MDNRGKIVIVSGFSGAGKGTLMKALMQQYRNRYALSVSATTRAPRPGESDGVDYFFVSRERFEQMIEDDALVEDAEYVGNYYGTPKAWVNEQLSAGKNVILEIEIQGAKKIREQFPDAILLFVTAPDAMSLKSRLLGRGTETEEAAAARLRRAQEESLGMDGYDYLVINDTVEECVGRIDKIVNDEQAVCENCRMSANTDYINRMKTELLSFAKGDES